MQSKLVCQMAATLFYQIISKKFMKNYDANSKLYNITYVKGKKAEITIYKFAQR